MKDKNKKKIAAIGRKEFTLGFELAGVQKTFNPSDKTDYKEKIEELTSGKETDIGILVLNEEDLNELPKRVQKQVNQSIEPVTVILSKDGESQRLQEKIKKAIGADITQ